MNTIRFLFYTIGFVLWLALVACGGETNPPVNLTSPPTATGFYADAGINLTTRDFSHDETWGYFVGIGYQVSKYWAADVRLNHEGLDADGSAVQGIGGRLVARMPFDYLSPYTFLGARFDLEPDLWRIQPGAGIELGLDKRLQGLRLFVEGGLDADLKGANGYLFGGGIRVRF